MTFEEVTTGTRVTMTHFGFGDDDTWAAVTDQLEGRLLGWSEAIADLAIYLQTGQATQRHFSDRADLGMRVIETDAGLRVHDIEPDGAAASGGLRRGDLLVSLDGVPVFRRADLWTLTRALARQSGGVSVAYARDAALLTASCPAPQRESSGAGR